MNTARLPRWLEVLRSSLLYLIGILVIAVIFMQYQEEGWNWASWDTMLISGLIAFIVALYFARTIPDKMNQTIDRLARRGAFGSAEDPILALFKAKIQERAQRFAKIGAVVVGVIILVSFIAAYGARIVYEIPLTILEVCLGLVAGFYIGQMVAYGFLGQSTRKEKIEVVAKPGHIDKAAGLKPIGDFYFYQAMIIAIPCLYIAIWWFIIPFFQSYSRWSKPYLGLLAIAMTAEILAFVVPMVVFHKIMRNEKIKRLNEADGLSEEIIKLDESLLTISDAKLAGDTQKQLDFLREKYWEIEQMPTWPVDAQTRRRFTVNNLVLLLPFISDAVKTSAPWKKFIEFMAQWLTSGGS